MNIYLFLTLILLVCFFVKMANKQKENFNELMQYDINRKWENYTDSDLRRECADRGISTDDKEGNHADKSTLISRLKKELGIL